MAWNVKIARDNEHLNSTDTVKSCPGTFMKTIKSNFYIIALHIVSFGQRNAKAQLVPAPWPRHKTFLNEFHLTFKNKSCFRAYYANESGAARRSWLNLIARNTLGLCIGTATERLLVLTTCENGAKWCCWRFAPGDENERESRFIRSPAAAFYCFGISNEEVRRKNDVPYV
jgi:hypothetical protein